MDINFLGATETVTGSKYLLSIDNKKILVDCGLYQGLKELRLRNWQQLPFDPKTIDAVILTHAHIDHSGYLPLFVKNGFKGPIYCTFGTKDLCEILLVDSAKIQEEDANFINKHKCTKYNPALPLYNVQDALNALSLFVPFAYNQLVKLDENTYYEHLPAGHIVGSSFVKLIHKENIILFTGDIGRPNDSVMQQPTIVDHADFLITESTYGDRLHQKVNSKIVLKSIINKTIERGGSVIIPAFAVGRTQALLHHLYELKNEGEIFPVPVYLDSPMAINATKILCKHLEDLRLTKKDCENLSNIATYVQTVEESMELDRNMEPKIIIAASGMLSGGRILFHLKTYASNPANTILFTGFQASGTRGADIIKGIKSIKIHGKVIPINAQIENLMSASAHADYSELLQWFQNFKKCPKKTFIIHGEKMAAESLKQKIELRLGWNCIIPKYQQTEILF
jgi:metallo-beta-lactamase family protein